jgi:hypothetical protein
MLYVNGEKKPAAMATGTFAVMSEVKETGRRPRR